MNTKRLMAGLNNIFLWIFETLLYYQAFQKLFVIKLFTLIYFSFETCASKLCWIKLLLQVINSIFDQFNLDKRNYSQSSKFKSHSQLLCKYLLGQHSFIQSFYINIYTYSSSKDCNFKTFKIQQFCPFCCNDEYTF